MPTDHIATISIDQIAGLFERVHEYKQSQANELIACMRVFLPRFRTANQFAEEARRKYAPGFNVFRLLEVQSSEYFHSNFLTYLLDPHAGHAQGDLFLLTFLKQMHEVHPDLPLPNQNLNHNGWLVQRELVTQYGNLDIVLRNPALEALYVIENKIEAGEQPDQIKRYGCYMADHNKTAPHQALLFLTKGGYDPLTAGQTRYISISYRKEIHTWLETVLPAIQAETVRETLRQYCSLIKSF